MLTLRADQARYPPDRWVIEQQPLHKLLQQADRVIAPPDVRQFVNQNSFHLLGAQTCELPMGSKITGRKKPMTTGTSARQDSISATGSDTRNRWRRRLRRACHSSGA